MSQGTALCAGCAELLGAAQSPSQFPSSGQGVGMSQHSGVVNNGLILH